MLKIQELQGAMPLDPHQGSVPGSRGPRSAAIESLPPPASDPSGSGPGSFTSAKVFVYKQTGLLYIGGFPVTILSWKLILHSQTVVTWLLGPYKKYSHIGLHPFHIA